MKKSHSDQEILPTTYSPDEQTVVTTIITYLASSQRMNPVSELLQRRKTKQKCPVSPLVYE